MKEIAVARAFAATGDRNYAKQQSGMTLSGTNMAIARPAVQAEIARLQQEKLFSEILPLAVKVHKDLLERAGTPAGARVQAVKLAYEHTLGREGASRDKEPHEMTPDELTKAIARLEQAAADQARDISPETAAESDIFE